MAGRPKTVINEEELKKLCAIQCTDEEIAAWFGCSTKTIQRLRKETGYNDIFTYGHARGRASLRRAQYQAAMKGNVAMLIWLGKVVLGQKETLINEHTGKDGGAIELSHAKAALLRGLVQDTPAIGTAETDSGAQ